MRYLALMFLAGVLACALGCTPEQEQSAGVKLTTGGKVMETAATVAAAVPGGQGIAVILGALATLTTAAGGYFAKKSSDRKKKNATLRANMTKEQRVSADKQIYGKKFDAKLSK